MKVTEDNYDILQKVSKITNVDYEIKWFDAENIDGYIDPEELLNMVEDLICEYDVKKEEFEDFKQYVEDNYRHLSYAEQIGWSHNW